MRVRSNAAVLLVALAASMHATAQSGGGPEPGAAAFAQNGCAACHGGRGEGTAAGPSLGATPLTLAEFTAAVRRGQRTMPAYAADALPDAPLGEIYAYLAAQPRANRAEGRTEVGARLYAAYGCYYCHANEAQGGVTGPRLGPAPITFARFEWYVRQPTQQMPPYSAAVVSEQDLADIYAFVASRPRPPPLESIPLLAP